MKRTTRIYMNTVTILLAISVFLNIILYSKIQTTEYKYYILEMHTLNELTSSVYSIILLTNELHTNVESVLADRTFAAEHFGSVSGYIKSTIESLYELRYQLINHMAITKIIDTAEYISYGYVPADVIDVLTGELYKFTGNNLEYEEIENELLLLQKFLELTQNVYSDVESEVIGLEASIIMLRQLQDCQPYYNDLALFYK